MTKHLNFKDLNCLLDGELRGDRKTQATEHVAACTPCAQKLNELRAVSKSVTQFGFQPAPAQDASSVWSSIEQELSAPPRQTPLFFLLRPIPSMAFSVAVLILVFTFFLFERRSLADNEAVIKSIYSENKIVMIFKTEERKITIIWLVDQPKPSQGGL